LNGIELIYFLLLAEYEIGFEFLSEKVAAVVSLNFYGSFPYKHLLFESCHLEPFANVGLNDDCSSYLSTSAVKPDACLVAIHGADQLGIFAAC